MMTPREIDALIAEKVFGWQWKQDDYLAEVVQAAESEVLYTRILPPGETVGSFPAVWNSLEGDEQRLYPGSQLESYSTDGNAALRVAEQLGSTWEVHFGRHYTGSWTCSLDRIGNSLYVTATAITAPMAFCLAALAAAGHPIKEVPST